MSDEPEAEVDYSALLTAARTGDASSFWRMCEGLRPRMRNLAAGQLRAGAAPNIDPSDIVQDAFLAAVRGFPQFRGQTMEELEAWLVQIVKREVQDARRYWHQSRRNVRRQAANLEAAGTREVLVSPGSSPSAQTLRFEQAQQILDLIVRLPEDEQRVIRLRHIEGKTLAEISEIIGRTPAAAAGLLKRGMARLREMCPDIR